MTHIDDFFGVCLKLLNVDEERESLEVLDPSCPQSVTDEVVVYYFLVFQLTIDFLANTLEW